MIVDGQVHGGIVARRRPGVEEDVVRDQDAVLAGSFMDYGMPRARIWSVVRRRETEDPTEGNPLGVKGGGEAGITPAPAVMMNAVIDALKRFGVTRMDMPATADRVWHAIQQAKAAKG